MLMILLGKPGCFHHVVMLFLGNMASNFDKFFLQNYSVMTFMVYEATNAVNVFKIQHKESGKVIMKQS